MKQQIHPALIIWSCIGFCSFVLILFWTAFTSDMEFDNQPVISKEEASEAAILHIQAKYQHTSLDSFVSYQAYKDLSGYLSQNSLVTEYHNSNNDHFPIDFFQVEITDTSNQQAYLVDVHMKNAGILGWTEIPAIQKNHTTYEINIAREYIQSMGHHPDDFNVINEQGSGLLIFENRQNRIGESYLQLYITVQNDRVASFHAKFSVPESYITWQEAQDQSTLRMSLLSLFISLFIAFSAIFIAVKYRTHITFSRGIVLTIVFFVTSAFHNFNTYPAQKAIFAGEINDEFIILFNIIISTIITFVMAAAVYLCLVSGDGLWKREGHHFWPRWRDSHYGDFVLRSMGIGYLFCLIILGFQRIMFFIGEQYFDVWTVTDAFHSNYNIMIPMLFPLLAWAAAISEEAIYRFFGIILFKKIVKNTFIAVLIPSMIWAMGHTQYPIYPAYTRFIEVTLLGLIFGYIFLKHGFITALFAHVSVNSILMGLSLIGIPGGTLHSFIGIFYMASPAFVAYIIYRLHARFRKAGPPETNSQEIPTFHHEELR